MHDIEIDRFHNDRQWLSLTAMPLLEWKIIMRCFWSRHLDIKKVSISRTMFWISSSSCHPHQNHIGGRQSTIHLQYSQHNFFFADPAESQMVSDIGVPSWPERVLKTAAFLAIGSWSGESACRI